MLVPIGSPPYRRDDRDGWGNCTRRCIPLKDFEIPSAWMDRPLRTARPLSPLCAVLFSQQMTSSPVQPRPRQSGLSDLVCDVTMTPAPILRRQAQKSFLRRRRARKRIRSSVTTAIATSRPKLDKQCLSPYIREREMIQNFKHKGLKLLYEKGSRRGVPPERA